MSNSLNKVSLIGRLGRDPEIRHTQSGQTVANFSLAVDESYKKDGEKVQRTEWVNVVVWGKLAENVVSEYMHKGDLTYIEGKLATRKYTDKNDVERTVVEVVLNGFDSKIVLLGSKRDNADKPRSEQRATTDAAFNEPEEDDSPF